MDIWLFIVEFDRPEYWEKCCKSWKEHASNPQNVKVYYVDNHSPPPFKPERLAELKSEGHIDEYHIMPSNVGPALARNHFWMTALKQADDETIFGKIDGHVEANPGWDKTITECFKNEADFVLLGKLPDKKYATLDTFFINCKTAKKLGGFKNLCNPKEELLGFDDIDYHIRVNKIGCKVMEYVDGSIRNHYCSLRDRDSTLKSTPEEHIEIIQKNLNYLREQKERYDNGESLYYEP